MFLSMFIKKRRKDILFKLNLKFSIKTFLRPRKKSHSEQDIFVDSPETEEVVSVQSSSSSDNCWHQDFVPSKLDWLAKRPEGLIWLGYFVFSCKQFQLKSKFLPSCLPPACVSDNINKLKLEMEFVNRFGYDVTEAQLLFLPY